MEQYISKSALVAEIEKLENKNYKNGNDFNLGASTCLGVAKHFVNTFEVREVDIEEELQRFNKEIIDDNGFFNPLDIAKHFFELGLHSTITEEDCKLIWNIGDEIPNMPEEEFFKELLKRFKAQKGEEV